MHLKKIKNHPFKNYRYFTKCKKSLKKIKMEKFEYRAYIKTFALLEISATEITYESALVYGHHALKYSTVAKLAVLLKESRDSFEDDSCSRRLITIHSQRNIDRLGQVIQRNSHSTYDDIIAETSVNKFTLSEFIHDFPLMRKLDSCWIPHNLTEKNLQGRVKIESR